jgi:hypothetical protein
MTNTFQRLLPLHIVYNILGISEKIKLKRFMVLDCQLYGTPYTTQFTLKFNYCIVSGYLFKLAISQT